MISEFNCNFDGKQLTVYENGNQIARFTDGDFTQFESLREVIILAMTNSPKAKVLSEEERIDAEIAILTERKNALRGDNETTDKNTDGVDGSGGGI